MTVRELFDELSNDINVKITDRAINYYYGEIADFEEKALQTKGEYLEDSVIYLVRMVIDNVPYLEIEIY